MTERLNITLPEHAHIALDVLENAGFEAWLVGGFVRDALLERACGDIDIACSACWADAKSAFEAAGHRVFETGTDHGTITAIVNHFPIEVTTYRTEDTYSDGRHPDSVRIAKTIEEDLARRDFTMNALAYHPDRGIVDPYGGRSDIRDRTIRTVGDAHERFREDALRILRACRFKSQLGFDLEGETLRAAIIGKRHLTKLSAERVTKELELFLLGDYVHDALMETVDVLAGVLPELVAMKGFEQKSPYHMYDVLEHTAYVIENTPAKPLVRWAALFHDIGKPAAFICTDGVGHFYGHAHLSVLVTKGIMERLSLPNQMKQRILYLVKVHDKTIHPSAQKVKLELRDIDGDLDLFRALCDLKRADALSKAPNFRGGAETADRLVAILEEIVESKDAYARHQLDINGRSVMTLGIEPGPRVGRLLDCALDAVINEEVANEHAALLAYVASLAGKPLPGKTSSD